MKKLKKVITKYLQNDLTVLYYCYRSGKPSLPGKGELLRQRGSDTEYYFGGNTTMKKVLALVLSVLMVLSLSVVAFAEEVEAPETTPGTDIDNADKKFELGFGDLEKPAADADPDKPGATYYYTIMDENDESGMLTDADIAKHLTVSIKEKGDKMIDSYSIVKQNGVYKVKVVTK